MTIEIHKPELEALIMERLKSGTFETVEDVLLQALRSAPVPTSAETRTGGELVAAMQDSPYKEVDLQATKVNMPVRDATF